MKLLIFLLAVLLPLALAQTTDERETLLKLISNYPEVQKVDLEKLWGDAPELKVTIILKNADCADAAAPVENSCATNPKRDCSCFEARLATSRFGFYQNIQPLPEGPEFEAFCTNIDGKLWTMIQRRIESNSAELGPEGFNRNYTEYENGFGALSSDFFIGLKNINALSQAADMTLMVDVNNEDYELRTGQFSTFKVAGPSQNYALTIGGQSGDVGSSLVTESNGKPFSAQNNNNGGNGCPASTNSGWWFSDQSDCGTCNLNGPMGGDYFACDTTSGQEKAKASALYLTPSDYLAN